MVGRLIQPVLSSQGGFVVIPAAVSVFVFQPGTTTDVACFTDSALANPITPPLVLDSSGSLNFYTATPQFVDLFVTGTGLTSFTISNVWVEGPQAPPTNLAPNAVATINIQDGAVTSSKIAGSSVSSSKVDSSVEVLSNKDVAGGYVGLSAAKLVALAELGTGAPSGTTYLRGDGTWSAGTVGPISGATDTNISAPADGDLLEFHTSDNRWHNEIRHQRTWEFFGGSHTAVAIQTAAWTAARAWSDALVASGAGGGDVIFGPYLYPHMPKMEMGNHMGIIGQGIRNTRLQFDASIVTGACVFNHVSTNGTTDPNAYACRIQSMTLDGSLLPGWGTNPVDGIVFDRLPRFGAAAAADSSELSGDAYHILRDVFIYTMPRDGAVVLSMGEQHWEKVAAKSSGRYGFQPPFDSLVVNCVADETRKEGFLITGAPAKLVGCKGFSCGNDAATRANGQAFHVQNIGQSEAVLVGCEAQDNYAAGFWVDNCSAPVSLIGCLADSNSVRGVGTDPGFDISGSPHVQLKGCISVERRVDGVNSFQQNAVSLRIDSNAAHIDMTHSGDSGGVVGSPFKAIGTGDVGIGSSVGFLNVNNIQGTQTPAFAASFTPDFFAGGTVIPGVITANMTINAPGNGPYPKGAKAEFILQQNGVGGFTITWNAIFKNTPATNGGANAYTAARFRFDGTNWIGI